MRSSFGVSQKWAAWWDSVISIDDFTYQLAQWPSELPGCIDCKNGGGWSDPENRFCLTEFMSYC
jgi:hypothetical protein